MLAGSDISIAEGREGWLFLERYLDARPLDFASNLSDWARTTLPLQRSIMKSRHERLAKRGIDFVFLVAPEKSSIYAEHLPDGIVPDLPTAAGRLTAAAVADGVQAIDLVSLLNGAKGVVPVYYDVDSHWTSFAAYRVYREILKRMPAHLDQRPIDFSAIRYHDRQVFGDLGIHLQPERTGYLQQAEIAGRDLVSVSDTFDEREYAFQQHTCPQGRGRALVVRDSFTTFLAPFLSRTFAETTYIAPPSVLPDDLIDDLRPDVVIVQLAERALFYRPDLLADWSIRGWRDIYLESESDHPARKQNRRTRQAMRENDWAEALLSAEAAALLDAEGRFTGNLAECRLRTGDAAGALAAVERADKHTDRYQGTLAALALAALGRRSEALDRLDAVLLLQPNNARLLIQKAEWLLEAQRPHEALSPLGCALAIAPGHATILYRLGEARHALGDFTGAKAAFEASGLI
ncbi:alginate O-acetyltransferase AlgX-related protein [Methylobacterium haplocladii]|uniref:AlgX/AlgJ SGNH hydrolase-like domain-containing protein n=1 Tax=Methylobacterium haplocladii TaxID=1176176 RepID=A0A512IPF2_9HYPH|nr:hypothetical protein [Methylobacterium haplocladii]GEO99586.1 hypothetical protein MHA02_19740 [Methylobacterium haplocladii]GJD85877.1 hypothetical protein HPGCJGGD_3772 [Methylobacterium haplocladii]GLS58562.1 hypothetical protein GCM10007887_12260 [Methylobacterium haplocladii]